MAGTSNLVANQVGERMPRSPFLIFLTWLLVAQTADALVVSRGGGELVRRWQAVTAHRWIAVRAESDTDGDRDMSEYKGERLARTEETLTAAGTLLLDRSTIT